MTASRDALASFIARGLQARNPVSETLFARESGRLASACRALAERLSRGGRLLAFGRGPYATDAQHVAVEFVHPVIVGKRALPALDVSHVAGGLEALGRPEDVAMGFGPPAGDAEIAERLARAGSRGLLTFALPGEHGAYALPAASDDPFVHQEMIEILYHTLWETVHVFLEHTPLEGQDGGAAGFLYPFLGGTPGERPELEADVARSIVAKARDDCALRDRVAGDQATPVADAVRALSGRLQSGGRVLSFGNGGSATDANDWALDCTAPPKPDYRRVPAYSLASEPGCLSGIANDVGSERVFARQLMAHAVPGDVVLGISTSGNSTNVVAGFREARKRRLLTIALLGGDGGEIARHGLAEHTIVVPTDYIPRIQEVQASIYHVMRDALEVLARG